MGLLTEFLLSKEILIFLCCCWDWTAFKSKSPPTHKQQHLIHPNGLKVFQSKLTSFREKINMFRVLDLTLAFHSSTAVCLSEVLKVPVVNKSEEKFSSNSGLVKSCFLTLFAGRSKKFNFLCIELTRQQTTASNNNTKPIQISENENKSQKLPNWSY